MVVYCAADLLWATRIKSTAEALQVPCRPVRSVDMLRARLLDSPIRGLIVDLDTADLALELVAEVRREPIRGGVPGEQSPEAVSGPGGRVCVVAFGPHVEVDLFERARRAGADRVFARGAFDRNLPEILRALEDGTL
jgi:hypothetical protein